MDWDDFSFSSSSVGEWLVHVIGAAVWPTVWSRLALLLWKPMRLMSLVNQMVTLS